jgi:hypothetical protein
LIPAKAAFASKRITSGRQRRSASSMSCTSSGVRTRRATASRQRISLPTFASTTSAEASARAAAVTAGSTDRTTRSAGRSSSQQRTHPARIGTSSSLSGTRR